MDTEKQIRALVRDPSYFLLLVGALLCGILLALTTGCNNSQSNDLPLLFAMQNDDPAGEDPPIGDLPDDPEAVADFMATPVSGTAPLTVGFIDSSQGEVSGYAWQFGDGAESDAMNPVHVYTEPGIYSVSLKVCDAQMRECTCERTGYIEVIDSPPAAAFNADVTSGAAALSVQFQDESEGNITQWLWDFGDNVTSELQNPSHAYSEPGVYSVTLTVSGPAGESQVTYEDFIQVAVPEVDLTPVALQVTGSRFKAGSAIQIEASIQNQGPDNFGEFNVTAYLSADPFISEDDVRIYDGAAEGIEAGGSIELTVPAFVPLATAIGYYAVIVRVSVTETAHDTNESNNVCLAGFPVMVYRSVDLVPRADTFVSSYQPYDSMGDMPVLVTEYEDESGNFSMIQATFDLSEIEAGQNAVVAAAKLHLYAVATTGGDTESLEVYAIEEEWSENCNWDEGPFPEPEMWAASSVPTIGWTEIELTQLVQAWLEGSVINNGIALYTWTDETAYAFYSRENDIGSYCPYLEIEIEPSSP